MKIMSGQIKIGKTVLTPYGEGVVVSEEIFKGAERWGVKLKNNPFSYPVAFFFKKDVQHILHDCHKFEEFL